MPGQKVDVVEYSCLPPNNNPSPETVKWLTDNLSAPVLNCSNHRSRPTSTVIPWRELFAVTQRPCEALTGRVAVIGPQQREREVLSEVWTYIPAAVSSSGMLDRMAGRSGGSRSFELAACTSVVAYVTSGRLGGASSASSQESLPRLSPSDTYPKF